MNVVPKVASIHARAIAPTLRRPPLSRPRLYVIDSPKMYLLAAVLSVVALLGVGAMANGLLRTSRALACEAPPAPTPQPEATPHATVGGFVDSVHVGNSSTET